MDSIGIDVHKNNSQVCILTEEGGADREEGAHDAGAIRGGVGWARGGADLIEASTESEWVARCLEELGHEVVRTGGS